MPNVVIYTTAWCPFCIRAKALLDRKGVAYEEIPVDGNPSLRAEMASKAGRTSVPQIWIGDKHVGKPGSHGDASTTLWLDGKATNPDA